jgi:hypothetical protein
MKTLFPLICLCFLLFSCEDVVEVDLEEAQPRLVVDAAIQWKKGETGRQQTIKLSRTRGFFNQEPIPVNGADISIKNSRGNTFNFEEENPGEYITQNFIPEIDMKYSLEINIDNNTYTAEEVLTPVVSIDSIQQNNAGGFSGEDIELKAFYKDPEGESNYYLFKFFSPFQFFPEFEIYDDEFNDGNAIFALYSDELLEPRASVVIQNHGASKAYYNFLTVLLDQAGSAGGPFQTQPATVRGNIKNIADDDELIFGYFSLSEVDELVYTIKDE